MAETRPIRSERVDDMPLVLAQRDRLGGQPLLDEHVPTHGNGVGLSLGWVTGRWLTPILSEADHRLNHGHPWAKPRLHTWCGATGQQVHPLDLSDDRLAAVLEPWRDDVRWPALEGAFTQPLLRVDDLQPERVRLETTTASGYWRVTAAGLLQFGHSKDHRPDLAQVKVLLSGLDPLGWPVATDVVPGQRADAPVYLPAIARVRESVGRRGVLYVGDGKMGALETRACIQADDDGYLCPVSESQLPPAVLESYLAPVAHRHYPVVRSRQLARAGARALRPRLAQARTAVTALNARGRGQWRFTERPALQAAGEASVTRARGQGLWAVQYTERMHTRRRRRDGSRPATVQVERAVHVQAVVDRQAMATARGRLGWRVYATNAPAERLSLAQAGLASRSQDLVESDMGRLKGHPLSLTPMYLQRDEHATGLIRLLSIGLRVLTLVAFVVRQRWATTGTVLAGVYPGNPKRVTARPTTERLLTGFAGLTLTIIREGRRRRSHLTPLSAVQRRILRRLNFPVDISTRLCPDAQKPP